ncbi:hypothetical protein F4808DRAFT_345357 [Astrocystis sublimbata]|nr:hypothetical protein F4808DRAFT_345357 [Astrocystis sublimbata]
MSHRRSDDDDLAYGERWNHERLAKERDRFEDRDRYYSRAPTRERPRDASVDDRFFDRRPPRPWDDDQAREPSVDGRFVERHAPRPWERGHAREASADDRMLERRAPRPWDDEPSRERKYYDEPPPRRRSPPADLERSTYIEKERNRGYPEPSPARRPGGLLRRQSSLDTFDRRPAQRMYDRDEYAPPARRREYRPEPYEPIPLPRSRALPPPRIYAEQDFEEIKVVEPSRYGDDEFHAYPEHVHEREVVRTSKHRDRSPSQKSHKSRRSRSSRAPTHHSRSHRSSSRSSSTSSSSETGGTVITAKSEYPKKGKTRIPLRLVTIRAIVESEYPYVIEGTTVIIQKALGQQNIDDLLKLSDEYKKADDEITAARSNAGALVEERKEELYSIPPPAPPTLIRAPPPPQSEVIKETVVREISPSRTAHTAHTATSRHTSRTPVVIEAQPREVSDNTLVGPLALVGDRRVDHYDHYHDYHHDHYDHHDHHHHSHSHSRERDLVRAERLPTGELVLYEQEIERIEEPRRGPRIEKDKKGRMSISVPKRK